MTSGTTASHRRILWATSIVGGATFAALAIGLVRNKAIALIGGPEAIGLLGIFTTMIAFGGALSTFGLDTAAVRTLSQSSDDPRTVRAVRLAMRSLVFPLAGAGILIFWLLRDQIAMLVTGTVGHAEDVALLGIGAAATAIGAYQIATIQASGRIKDLARLRMLGAIAGTTVSVAVVYYFGLAGLVVAALAIPTSTAAVATLYAPAIPKAVPAPTRGEIANAVRSLVSVGGVVMMAYATSTLTNLAERSIVFRELGAVAAGEFHACAAILWVNLTLILNAMAADYYPRLARTADSELAGAVNRQLHVLILLAAPVFVFVSVAAPLLLTLLYSSQFTNSASLLRLLILAGVLRLPVFALGYLLLAKSGGRQFWLGELAGTLLLPVVWLLVVQFGLPGLGVGAILIAAATFATYIWMGKAMGVRLDRTNSLHLAGLFTLVLALWVLFGWSSWAGYVVGGASGALIGALSFRTIRLLWAQ